LLRRAAALLCRLLRARRRRSDCFVGFAQAQSGTARVAAPGGQDDRLRLFEGQRRVLLQFARRLRVAAGRALP
jgi:hypothetical protein